MTPDNFLQFIFNFDIWTLAKIMVDFLLFMYVVFAFVVVKQVSLMLETIPMFGVPLRFLAFIHLIMAIFVFFLAIIVL